MSTADRVEALVGHLGARDRDRASALMHVVETSGAEASDLIDGLLAPAQVRVGALWQSNEWSVADEHAATAIVDRLLADVARSIDVIPTRPEVVVACAEGDWHSLPARMFSELLRSRGWLVTFLGGSTPASHLGRFVRAVRPHAVAISCTVPVFLTGATRSVAAVTDQGVPVLTGGAAFGPDERRSRAVGATGWASSIEAADEILEKWQLQAPEAPPSPPYLRAALALAADRPDILAAAMAALRSRLPEIDSQEEVRDQIEEELDDTLRFVEASVLTGDGRILDDLVQWRRQHAAAHPPVAVPPRIQFEVLRESIPRAHIAASSLLANGD